MKEKIKKLLSFIHSLFKEEPPHPPTLNEFLWHIAIFGGITVILLLLWFIGNI